MTVVGRELDFAMIAIEFSKMVARVGLRARLVILVLVAVVPLVALLIAGSVADREFALANARAEAVGLARFGAERQAAALEEARELLRVLRRLPAINSGDPATCQEFLRVVADDHPQFYTVGVVDPDGMISCHSIITNRQLLGDTALVQQAMAPDAPPFIVGKFRVGPVTGKPTVIMASRLPGASDSTRSGVVFVSLNLASFEQVATELAGSANRAVLVIDLRTATVLARAPERQGLVGHSFGEHPLIRAMVAAPEGGGIDVDGLSGEPRIFGFAPLPAAGTGGAMIAVGLARTDVLADANRRFLVGLSIVAIAMAGALIAASWFANVWQVRPIHRLVDTAERLRLGDLSARSAVEAWQAPELRTLGTALDSMAAAIELPQKKLQDSEAELRAIADNSTDMIFRLGLDFRRTYVSMASREILGYEPSELIGKRPANMAHPEDGERVIQSYRDLLAGQERSRTITRIQHRDGHWVWIEVHKRALRDPKTGAPVGILGTMRDISQRKQIEEELEAANLQLKALAAQDGLTGLANRRTFDEVLDREWRRAARDGASLGLIMLDVDNFKRYNDLYGHQGGDGCLCAVARAIEGAVRRPADFMARYGGEEFVIVMPNTDEAGAVEVAERIRQSVPGLCGEHRGNSGGVVTISAGVWAGRTTPPSNARAAIKSADENLYAAKTAGRNRVVCGVSLLTKAV